MGDGEVANKRGDGGVYHIILKMIKKMRKLLPLLFILASLCAATASGRSNPKNHRKATKTTATAVKQNTDDVYETISKAYARGAVSADSVVGLALYHKSCRPDVAERCLKLASDGGSVRGTTELGVLYAFSPAYSNRVDDGVRLLQSAAQAGSKEAAGYLGYYYFTGKDYAKAKSYLDAAKPLTMGIEYAMLGSMYLEGNGVAESGSKARENFYQSARLGLPRGMALYASLLGTKNGGSIDYPDSFFWFYIAGELGDNYSRVMLYRPRVPEAQPSSEVGQDAQTALSWIETVHSGKSLKNEPVYKDGFLKGLKERELAAERGDDWSRFYLGGMNYNGDFLNQNYGQALRYYEAIAKNNSLPHPMLALVHERLADMYRHGKGVKANSAKAEQHDRIASKYGSVASYKIIENIRE